MRPSGNTTDLRRKAVITAAFCAILGGVVPAAIHAHRWIGFSVIAVQAVLFIMALSFFVRSNQPAANK
ncbi:MAG TPA: hypothetical protein VIY53_21115 [Acidobacteriaceae bacterium]